ncbi:MAG: SGNH/GDSL hydrolase family protein [archaeon]
MRGSRGEIRGKRTLLFKLILLLLTILVFFLSAEILLRIIGAIHETDYRLYMKELVNSDRLPGDLFYNDSGLQRLRPNYQVLATTSDYSVIYKTNKQGLRDKDYDYLKPPDKIRVLAFGDSYTFGEGVKYGDRFTDIAESQDTEIINFGFPGYGIDQELLLFKDEGLRYSADYVAIFINKIDVIRYSTDIIENDSISFDSAPKAPKSSSNTLYAEREDAFFGENSNALLQRSYFLSYLRYKIRLLLLKNHLEKYDKDRWEPKLQNILNSGTPVEDRIKNRTIIIINKFYELCKKEDMALIIIKIDPYGELDFIKKINENISYYDLTEELMNESKQYDLSFKYDPHYNKRTHEFIGYKMKRILSEIISQNSLKNPNSAVMAED